MKKVLCLALLAVASMSTRAQSCDGAYPEGYFDSEWPEYEGTKPYAVDLQVLRVVDVINTDNEPALNGKRGCGYISVTNNKTNRTEIAAVLTYAGKGLEGDMGNGVYYFNLQATDGKSSKMGLKLTELGVKIMSLTSPFASHPIVGMEVSQMPPNGSWTPVGVEARTDADILDALRGALDDYDKDRVQYRTRGFGNAQQFISAHRNLDSTKPKYLKSKGTGAINIRKDPSTTAAKVGELPAGQTLLVVDEYDGWCQVKIDNQQFGWVSLSVVTLTNTPSATPASVRAAVSDAAASFVLAGGKLGPLSIGQTVASLPKSVPGLYDRYEYKKQTIENDMEGSWDEEWCHFYKGGKEIFKCFAEGRKLTSFVLEGNASHIKTSEGFYVGCPARDVYQKKRMQWETYYEGTSFARNGHWEYHIPDAGLNNVEFPTKLADIKPTAKISMIVYYKDLPE